MIALNIYLFLETLNIRNKNLILFCKAVFQLLLSDCNVGTLQSDLQLSKMNLTSKLSEIQTSVNSKIRH